MAELWRLTPQGSVRSEVFTTREALDRIMLRMGQIALDKTAEPKLRAAAKRALNGKVEVAVTIEWADVTHE